MELATIHVSGVNAKVVQKAPVPVNIIGGYVDVIFDDDWDGLVRTAVIHGAKDLDVVNVGNRFEIPQETVSESGIRLKVGFYGVSQDGGRGIPTLWADLGVIQEAADPSGDESTDPALPVWAQLQALIGDLNDLDTTAKETIVAAINEALTKGGADPAEVARLVEEYLEQNPITADEIGAVGKEELPTAINEALAQAKASGEFKGESGQPGKDGQDGKDYVLTPADKTEIAEMAAELVDVPEGSGAVSGTLLPETEVTPGTSIKGFGYKDHPVGEKLATIIDGKPYITTHIRTGEGADAYDFIGNLAMFNPGFVGTEYDTGEPFAGVLYDNFCQFGFADGASHKVAICTVDVLDEVYVRALNSIGNMSGGSGSFVVNVTVDGALTVTSADKTYEEINGALESGMSVVAVAGDLNFPYAGLNLDNGCILFAFNGGTQGSAELILILSVTPENVWSMTVKDFITAENIGMKYVSSNTFNAFTKGVAKVPTASVGQTIKVKSVDDNGVPTAWEAVDFPSVPTKVSQLANDSGFQTESEVTAIVEEAIADIDIPSGGGGSGGNVDLTGYLKLPTNEDGTPDNGTVGYYAVSDGNGGVTWVEAGNAGGGSSGENSGSGETEVSQYIQFDHTLYQNTYARPQVVIENNFTAGDQVSVEMDMYLSAQMASSVTSLGCSLMMSNGEAVGMYGDRLCSLGASSISEEPQDDESYKYHLEFPFTLANGASDISSYSSVNIWINQFAMAITDGSIQPVRFIIKNLKVTVNGEEKTDVNVTGVVTSLGTISNVQISTTESNSSGSSNSGSNSGSGGNTNGGTVVESLDADFQNRFKDKILIFHGDSLCGGDAFSYTFAEKTFVDLVTEWSGMNLSNLSQSNTGFKERNESYYYKRLTEWQSGHTSISPDVFLIFGNMNDAQTDTDLQVGTKDDASGTDSLYGLMRQYIEKVIELYPSAQIGFITSPPRRRTFGTNVCYGHNFYEEWIIAQKYLCEEYSIPFLDLYHNSFIRPTSSANLDYFFQNEELKGTHFNQEGHNRVAYQVYAWLMDNF